MCRRSVEDTSTVDKWLEVRTQARAEKRQRKKPTQRRPQWRAVMAELKKQPELRREKEVEKEVIREVLVEQLKAGQSVGELGASINYPSNNMGGGRYCGACPDSGLYGFAQKQTQIDTRSPRQRAEDHRAEQARRSGPAQYWKQHYSRKPGRPVLVEVKEGY